MANPLRDMSVIMQGLVAAAIAVVLVLVGIYLPFSPVAQEKDQVDKAVQQRAQLTQEVQQLQVYQRRFGELKQEMDALKTIVPEEKETDEFIRQLQGAAAGSNVAIRQLKAKAVVPKDNNYYEMPFEIQADGPYFNVLDFFGRLSRLSRIINVGDLEFADPEKARGGHYTLRPGSTVSGVFTATTYFTKPGDTAPTTAAAKPKAKN